MKIREELSGGEKKRYQGEGEREGRILKPSIPFSRQTGIYYILLETLYKDSKIDPQIFEFKFFWVPYTDRKNSLIKSPKQAIY